MTQLEVLVEEPSAEEAMRHVLPKKLGQRTNYKIINLGSKYKLLKVLGEGWPPTGEGLKMASCCGSWCW